MKSYKFLLLLSIIALLGFSCKDDEENLKYRFRIRVLKNLNLPDDSLVMKDYKIVTNVHLSKKDITDKFHIIKNEDTLLVLKTNPDGYINFANADGKIDLSEQDKEIITFDNNLILECFVYSPTDTRCDTVIGQGVFKSSTLNVPETKFIYIDNKKLHK